MDIGIFETIQIDAGPASPIVPPKGYGIQFNGSRKPCRMASVSSVAGAQPLEQANAENLLVRLRVVVVTVGRRQVGYLLRVSDQTGDQSI